MAETNQAIAYGVRVLPAPTSAGQTYWKAVEVRHLTPAENRGRNHLYVDAVDADGQRVRDPDIWIGWTWEGRHPEQPAPPARLDKAPGEPMGNLPIYRGQVITAWIAARCPSDAVEGIRTNHPDEPGPNGELWNSLGHHSFYLKFQLTIAGGTPNPAEPDEPVTLESLARRVTHLEQIAERWTGD